MANSASTTASSGPVLEFFFLHLFLAPGGGGSCAAARRSHKGSGLEAEVLGGGFGRRTTPCWMGAELNGGEGDDSNKD